MQKLICALAAVAIWRPALCAQGATTPQTARQALLEMFCSKTQAAMAKHLPAATVAALEKSGAITRLEQYSLLANQFEAQGNKFQVFETGSVLLSGEDPKSGQKVVVAVENDSLHGEEDDIELSFLTYKNGQPERTPLMPRMTFALKQEGYVWKLNEISITIRLPLADPDLLKVFTENMKAREAARISVTPRNPNRYFAGGFRCTSDRGGAQHSKGRAYVRDDLPKSGIYLHSVGPGWIWPCPTQ